MRGSHITAVTLACAAGLFLAAGCSGAATPAADGAPLDGKAVVEDRCTICHATDRILSANHTAAEWDAVVTRMEGKGLSLTPAQRAAILKYVTGL